MTYTPRPDPNARVYVSMPPEPLCQFLTCADCGELWSLRIPDTAGALRELVKNNSRCIECGSTCVLRGGQA